MLHDYLKLLVACLGSSINPRCKIAADVYKSRDVAQRKVNPDDPDRFDALKNIIRWHTQML